ncbi:uncharacterized protein [Panulirus ornatus]|uniref:uncharacterized protein n=1 Tax=Panulirus ornatus TaxID=150431 RepID=UPI003A862444
MWRLWVPLVFAVAAVASQQPQQQQWKEQQQAQQKAQWEEEEQQEAWWEEEQDPAVVVKLEQGFIRGILQEAGPGRPFYSFKGVPYAEPPLGDLRFKDPVPAGRWHGDRDGSIVAPSCPQLSLKAFLENKMEVEGSEDCLYLNVFTPARHWPYTSDLPVMVYIHGGGFVEGNMEAFGPQLLLKKDVVVVVIQYRLGVLGFLSTEDSVLPGNLGLKDQTLALRWVQDNIRHLGGSPARVTIFGESAGSASVHYHILSPHSSGLFSRAILQSGTALCPFALREDHRQVAFSIGEHLNCSGAAKSSFAQMDSNQLLACFNQVPVRDLVLSTSSLHVSLKITLFLSHNTPYHVSHLQPLPYGLPVMVWLHGGAFQSGGGEDLYAPLPLMTKDIVLVAVQFRLGTLGYLSTEDSVMPGNLGIKDALLALRWLQENVRSFGGDPSKVTIFGESSGGAMVHFLLMMPRANGLFRRAIMQSGTALCPWAIREDHSQVAQRLGHMFNCTDQLGRPGYVSSDQLGRPGYVSSDQLGRPGYVSSDQLGRPGYVSSDQLGRPGSVSSDQLLSCFQQVPTQQLVLAAYAFRVWNFWPTVMRPRVDGDYILDHPATLMRAGRFNKVDLITGVTQHEGATECMGTLVNATLRDSIGQDFEVAGPASLLLEPYDVSPVYTARRVYHRYLGSTKVTLAKATEFMQMFSDAYHKICQAETAFLHTVWREAGRPQHVFKYELQHRGEHSLADIYQSTLNKEWVGHADDLQYVFNAKPSLRPRLRQPDDLLVSQLMLTLWTNFADTGNPTPDGSLGFRWWPTTESRQWYLALTTSPTMKNDTPTPQVLEFWKNLPTKKNMLLYPELFLKNRTCPALPHCAGGGV